MYIIKVACDSHLIYEIHQTSAIFPLWAGKALEPPLPITHYTIYRETEKDSFNYTYEVLLAELKLLLGHIGQGVSMLGVLSHYYT